MRKNIRIAVVMLLVLALATAGVSFAWFMENMEIKVSSGENMNISVGGDLQVKWHDGDTWGSQLRGSVTNLTMLDCSGNGLKFFTGDVDDAGNPHAMYEIEKDKFEGSVLEVAIDLRTSHKMDVYLGSLSAVSPVIDKYVDLEQNPNADHNNSLSGGEFSADWIAAAARVAFIEVEYDEDGTIKDDSEQLKFIWVPNADKKLSTDGTGYTFEKNSEEIETEYTYCLDISDEGAPITTTVTYEKASITNTFVPAQGNQLCTSDAQNGAEEANLSPKIVSFEPNGEMQEKHIIIRIWFEGYDNECTAAMVGGKVTYTFSFAGMLAREAADVTDFIAEKFNAISNAENGYTLEIPNSLKGKIIYSTNGFDYSDYTEGTVITNATEVYLRIKETQSTYASDILKIDLAPQGGGQ